MSHLFNKLPKLVLVPLAIGALNSLLGITVILGWHTQNISLIQILPEFVPMQYNTALGQLICGLGIIAYVLKQNRLVIMSGSLAGILGILTLLQYLFQIDFGIDRLIVDPYIFVKTSHPGRMGMNTAFSYMLTGFAFLVLGVYPNAQRRSMFAGLLASVITALGLVAFFGYISGIETAQGWGRYSSMAIHTASGFVFLGLGLLFLSWMTSQKSNPMWLPIPVGAGTIAFTLCLWQALGAHDHRQIDLLTQSEAEHVASEIGIRIASDINGLKRMAQRWEKRQGTPYEEWEADGKGYVNDIPGLQAVEWINSSYRVKWIVPKQGNEAAQDLDVTFEGRRRDALTRAQQEQTIVLTSQIDLVQGGRGFLVYVPIFIQEQFDGFIVGVYKTQKLFDSILHNQWQNYAIGIHDSQGLMYARNTLESNTYAKETELTIHGTIWQIKLQPHQILLDEIQSSLAEITLSGGLLLSLLMMLVLYINQKSQQRAATLQVQETDLKAYANELERSNQDLVDFANIVSHDLQEPLRKVSTFCDLLKSEYGDQLTEDGELYMGYMTDATGRMQTLIHDLLAYSRITTKGQAFEPVDLSTIANDVVADLQIRITETKGLVEIKDLPTIQADPLQMRQLFQNLIGNGLKFHKKDTPPVIVVESLLQDEPNTHTLQFQDNGIGFDPEYSDRIFEIFQRLHTRDTYEGTGVGLALCRKIIERHKGTIIAQSAHDQGARFVITLPTQTESA